MSKKSNYNPQFSTLPNTTLKRSQFSRISTHKTTMNAGELIPFYHDEVLPGDTFNLKTNLFGRLSTPITPVMDNIYLDVQYFFVPNRLLWNNFKRFMGEQDSPDDSTDYLIPQIVHESDDGVKTHSISDYLGIPTEHQCTGLKYSALWHRAYNLIWNSFYRDQNLQESIHVPLGDGPDSPNDYQIMLRNKRKDYFTSCLPWPQKGPGVPLPVSGSATLDYSGLSDGLFVGTVNNEPLKFSGLANRDVFHYQGQLYTTSNNSSTGAKQGYAKPENLRVYNDPGKETLAANLETDNSITINSLRQAFLLQKLLERDARGGTRYVELLKSHFGVTSPDFRLQRPEFLGSGSTRLNVSAVAQTSETNVTPQGNLSGIGTLNDQNGFTKSFTEHGVILGLASVRCDLTYQTGLHRKFSRRTRYDFYFPTLAHLGEQEVLNKELYAQNTETDEIVFGYQSRWDEYRYGHSQITGKLRSNDPQSLDLWHTSQDFSELPKLNSQFIEEHPPLDRIVAVTDEPQIILDCYFDLKCTRVMPMYSLPGMSETF